MLQLFTLPFVCLKFSSFTPPVSLLFSKREEAPCLKITTFKHSLCMKGNIFQYQTENSLHKKFSRFSYNWLCLIPFMLKGIIISNQCASLLSKHIASLLLIYFFVVVLSSYATGIAEASVSGHLFENVFLCVSFCVEFLCSL